jgi:hypothetical protein
LSGFVVRGCCIAHITNRSRFPSADNTEDNSRYCTPTTFVWRDTVRSRALIGSVSDMSTAKALVAPQSRSARRERVRAVLVGLQAAWECLIPAGNLSGI